ncbi:MAG: hypothetical protein HY700_10880 [Gemmatimonadetes bacterium]|nr:hypothetical protein [Gemmatimonadota bacterium]
MAVNVDRTLRLPDSEYFPEPQRKSGIAIHHTVCGAARTTFELWRKDSAAGGPRRVTTAYLIEREGTIYEIFDPAAWAYQFGLSWPDDRRIPFEKRQGDAALEAQTGVVAPPGKPLCLTEGLDPPALDWEVRRQAEAGIWDAIAVLALASRSERSRQWRLAVTR